MSLGNTATPPQPIGSPQPTKVRPATDGGAAKPSHQTGRLVPSTPSTSRTTPSGDRDIWNAGSGRELIKACASCGARASRQGHCENDRSQHLISAMQINL